MTVGERIRYRRQQLGMTQGELAAKLGCSSKTSVSNIENRMTSPKFDMMIRFADALDCTAAWLYGIDDEEPPVVSTQILTEEEEQILDAYRHKSPAEREAFRTLLGIRGDA